MEYQTNYTENPVARSNMYNEGGRARKAEKIVAILGDYLGDLQNLSILDVSCSTGYIPRYFAQHFHKVTGIDIDEAAVTHARSGNNADNLEFHVMDALETTFPDNTFNVVVCNQMYEHVPDADKLMDEILRILVPGGTCYFGATNRLKVIETHYGTLPFLSYLPKPAANLYLRITGRGQYYYENLYTYWTLRKLCSKFDVIDYTGKVISHPEDFGVEGLIAPGSRKQQLALLLLKYAYWFSPGYIWLLKKPAGNDAGQ
jgi:2-polyprenyl-3-methyl-5-hydroxy-6-metoxy-1,4-benzoquinol methylase